MHLCAGDLLREEAEREGSPYKELIHSSIKEGQVVPMEITISLLKREMEAGRREGRPPYVLVDGFPREIRQGKKFEEEVCRARRALLLDCSLSEMEARLLARASRSGRADDNAESVKKRFRVPPHPLLLSFLPSYLPAMLSFLLIHHHLFSFFSFDPGSDSISKPLLL